MKDLAAAIASVMGVLQGLRLLLSRKTRGVPTVADDGVSVASFTGEPVVRSEVWRKELRWGHAAYFAGSILLAAIGVAAMAAGNDDGWFALAEGLLLAPRPLWVLFVLRGKGSAAPVHETTREVVVRGDASAVARRVVHALYSRGALRIFGSRVSLTDDRFVVEGGTGNWGITRDQGYRIEVRGQRGASDQWHVKVVGSNFVPTVWQAWVNNRNVRTVVDHLIA